MNFSITNDENGKGKGKEVSRGRAHSIEKTARIKPMLVLKQQESMIERGLKMFLENSKVPSEVIQVLLQKRDEMYAERQSMLGLLSKDMNEITKELEFVKIVAANCEEIQRLDMNDYKLKLLKLSQKIQDFKKCCTLQTLSEERVTLETELHEFELNLHKYDSKKNAMNEVTSDTPCLFSKMNNVRSQDYKEIYDFHTLVAKTGHTESWTNEDHLLFLKMRKKCNSIPALISAIQMKCPDLSMESIINHESWYKTYLHLREKQKLIIKEWRKRKESEKSKIEEKVDSKEDIHKDKIATISEEKSSSTVKSRTILKPSITINSNTDKKKELIEKWKTEKENKRAADQEQIKSQIILKRTLEEKHRKQRLKKIQESLNEYKAKKLLEQTLKEIHEKSREKQGKSDCNYVLLKSFRKQDAKYTKRRQDLILRSKKQNQNERTKILQPKYTSRNSCSTLLNSTIVWNEKCRLESPRKRTSELYYIKDIPRLYLRWRNEESMELKSQHLKRDAFHDSQ